MLDLETLGRSAGCVVLSIGAVRFDMEKGLQEEFYRVIDLDTSLAAGLKVEPETVAWWFQQEPEARKVLLEAMNGTACGLRTALQDLQEFLKPDDLIWGNGATFDNAIVVAAAEAVNLPRPWSYRNDRCFRTLRSLYPDVNWPQTTGILHHALDDAKTQAQLAVKIMLEHRYNVV
jgi:hypothetical protein